MNPDCYTVEYLLINSGIRMHVTSYALGTKVEHDRFILWETLEKVLMSDESVEEVLLRN